MSEICFDILDLQIVDSKMSLDLSDLGVMERRKMSLATKMIWVASRNLIGKYPLIFASNYGEVARNFVLLSDLSRSGFVSPNNFSYSVLNANIANAAILKKYHGTINAISTKAALEMACFVGFGNLRDDPKVCVIVYEEDYYQSESYCIAFLISKGNSVRLKRGKIGEILHKILPIADLSLKNFIALRFGAESKNFILKDEKNSYLWSFGGF